MEGVVFLRSVVHRAERGCVRVHGQPCSVTIRTLVSFAVLGGFRSRQTKTRSLIAWGVGFEVRGGDPVFCLFRWYLSLVCFGWGGSGVVDEFELDVSVVSAFV